MSGMITAGIVMTNELMNALPDGLVSRPGPSR